MSELGLHGVLYTEYQRLRAHTPLLSLWSFRSSPRKPGRPAILQTSDGDQEYWLERSDPLLNTILPGTAVSLVVNLSDAWAAGRTLVSTEVLPPACVIGPVTRARVLHVGRNVHAVGAVLPAERCARGRVCRSAPWPAPRVGASGRAGVSPQRGALRSSTSPGTNRTTPCPTQVLSLHCAPLQAIGASHVRCSMVAC